MRGRPLSKFPKQHHSNCKGKSNLESAEHQVILILNGEKKNEKKNAGVLESGVDSFAFGTQENSIIH